MPLIDNALEKWVYKEHTKVKHGILQKYISSWIRILGRWHSRVCYFDCFAGRGKYEDGTPGSPLIAMEKASELKKQFTYLDSITCTFIEKNKDNFQNLKSVIETEKKGNPEKYEKITIIPINNEFANVGHDLIKNLGDILAPSFFFIDPFGFKGVPFDLIKQILSIEKTEVFITFMVRDVNRFLESSKHRISIEELYGIENVQTILSEKYGWRDREDALLTLYRDRLHEGANVKYPFPFKVSMDKTQQTIYYLIHATNHPMGCELMKEIMCKAGTEGRFGYLGPEKGQTTLMQCGGLGEFEKFLIDHFKGQTLLYQNVRYLTLMDTTFIKKDYRQVLKKLNSEGKISIKGGPRGGLPDDAQITFL